MKFGVETSGDVRCNHRGGIIPSPDQFCRFGLCSIRSRRWQTPWSHRTESTWGRLFRRLFPAEVHRTLRRRAPSRTSSKVACVVVDPKSISYRMQRYSTRLLMVSGTTSLPQSGDVDPGDGARLSGRDPTPVVGVRVHRGEDRHTEAVARRVLPEQRRVLGRALRRAKRGPCSTGDGQRTTSDGRRARSGGDNGVTTSRRTNEATSDDRQKTSGASSVAACKLSAAGGVPNKPVLPTAPTSPNHYAPGPLRRQTGQPLGSPEG